jgi:hypothetical protein
MNSLRLAQTRMTLTFDAKHRPSELQGKVYVRLTKPGKPGYHVLNQSSLSPKNHSPRWWPAISLRCPFTSCGICNSSFDVLYLDRSTDIIDYKLVSRELDRNTFVDVRARCTAEHFLIELSFCAKKFFLRWDITWSIFPGVLAKLS